MRGKNASLLEQMMDAESNPGGSRPVNSNRETKESPSSSGDPRVGIHSSTTPEDLSPESVANSGLHIPNIEGTNTNNHSDGSNLFDRVVNESASRVAPSNSVWETAPALKMENTRINLTPEQEKLRGEYIALQQEALYRIFELRSVERAIDIKYGKGNIKNIDLEKEIKYLEERYRTEGEYFRELHNLGSELHLAKEFLKVRREAIDSLAKIFTKLEEKAVTTDPKTLQIETLEEQANRIKEIFNKALLILNKSGKDVVAWFKSWTQTDFLVLRAALEGCSECINSLISGREIVNKTRPKVNPEVEVPSWPEVTFIQEEIARLKKVIDELDIGGKASSVNRQLHSDSRDPFFQQPLDKALSQLGDSANDEVPTSMRNLFQIHDELASFENLLNFLESEYLAGPGENFKKFKKLMRQLNLKPFKWWNSPLERED
jgi:hypothetical protein